MTVMASLRRKAAAHNAPRNKTHRKYLWKHIRYKHLKYKYINYKINSDKGNYQLYVSLTLESERRNLKCLEILNTVIRQNFILERIH